MNKYQNKNNNKKKKQEKIVYKNKAKTVYANEWYRMIIYKSKRMKKKRKEKWINKGNHNSASQRIRIVHVNKIADNGLFDYSCQRRKHNRKQQNNKKKKQQESGMYNINVYTGWIEKYSSILFVHTYLSFILCKRIAFNCTKFKYTRVFRTFSILFSIQFFLSTFHFFFLLLCVFCCWYHISQIYIWM